MSCDLSSLADRSGSLICHDCSAGGAEEERRRKTTRMVNNASKVSRVCRANKDVIEDITRPTTKRYEKW